MPRQARATRAGGVYLVSHRCIAGHDAFRSSNDFKEFKLLLAERSAAAGVELLGWCLLPGALQLLARPARDEALGLMMRGLLTTQVQRHRVRYGHEGPLWRGRYQSIEMEDGAAVARTLSSMASLPAAAGLGGDWPWTFVPEPRRADTARFVATCLERCPPPGGSGPALVAAAERLRRPGRPRQAALVDA